MSFNYLEVARVAELIKADLPSEVQGVEVMEFPLPGAVPDLNVGIRLASKRMIVLSLRNPFTSFFYAAPGLWRTSRQPWAKVFDGAQDWNPYLRGQELTDITVADQERIIEMSFSNGATLRVELFPARPNWVLRAGGEEFLWRKPVPPKAPKEEAALRLVPLRPQRTLVLREFEAARGKELNAAKGPEHLQWMERAYNHYLKARQDTLFTTQLQRAQAQMQTRVSQMVKVRGQMKEALAESAKAESSREKGERLKGLIYEHPKTFRGARIEDIELDPQLTLAENSAKYFDRYKKQQRTKREVEARLGGIEEASKKITATVAKLRAFKRDDAEPFEAAYKRLVAALTEAGIAAPGGKEVTGKLKKSEQKWEKAGVRKFQSREGLSMWVGRNHSENEELVIRLARGNDMWMHLKGKPGAHLIVQLVGGKSPSLETLLDGAILVAYYSGVQNNEKVEVDYTYRKNVRRVPGQKEKFLVTYTQNKTLVVKVEEERLWELLKQHSF